ncbi:MAG: TonB-dependent receptor domain-containing protein [bacterium]
MDNPKRLVALIFLLFMVPIAGHAQNGTFSGYVRDQYSQEPLPDVNIVLVGTPYGASSNNAGYFEIKALPVGKYLIQVSRIGYATLQQEVVIKPDQGNRQNFQLRAQAVLFNEVLVTATREKALNSEVSVATDIIPRSEIDRSASQNIGEILESLSHVFVKNYGNLGALKTVTMRGASENQVLILLDGQRLNLAQGIAPDLSDIPVHAIERIEVTRGGNSALYGTDAIGGVINLITRGRFNQKAVNGGFNSTIGSFGTRIVSANFGQTLGAFNYFVAHEYAESDGDFRFENDNSEKVKRSNNNLKWNDTFVKLNYSLNPSTYFSGYLQLHDADRGVPGPLSFPSESATQKDNSKKFNFKFDKYFSTGLNLQVQTFFYHTIQNFDDSSAFFPIHSLHKNDAFGFSLQSNWRQTKFSEFTGGVEYRQDKINSTDVAKQKQTIGSAFVQNEFKFPLENLWSHSHLSLVPAFRVDKVTGEEAQWSPKFGFHFSHASNYQFIVRGNWGRSFRVPSFNDLHWPAGSFTAGNPDLVPEEGTSYDFGMMLNFQKAAYWGFEISFFQTQLDNLILWGPRADGVWSPDNLQKASIRGLELKFTVRDLGRFFNLVVRHNYLRAVDNSEDSSLNGRTLVYRPSHKLDLTADFDFEFVTFNWIYQYVGKRFTAPDNSTSLTAYHLNHLSLVRRQSLWGGTLKISGEIRNLFDDEQVQVIAGFPISGREYRTVLGFEF